MTSIRAKLRRRWRAFAALPAGKRFQRLHEQQKDAPAWAKPLVIAGALASLAAAVVLTIFPGPAFVFYGLAAALLATRSVHLARLLDRAELAARALWARVAPSKSSRPAPGSPPFPGTGGTAGGPGAGTRA